MTKEEFKKVATPYLEKFSENIFDYYHPEEKRSQKVWYASDLGKCPSGVYYAREGKLVPDEIPQFAKNVMHEGRMKELDIILRLILEGTEIFNAQERLHNESLDISGRYDVLYKNKENGRMVVEEIKTVNSRAFWYRVFKNENNEPSGIQPQEEHVLQITFYLHELIQKFPDLYGILRYRSRDDGTEFKSTIFYDERNWQKVTKILDELNKAWTAQKPPDPVPAVVFDDIKHIWVINWKTRYCDYHRYCTNDPDWLKNATRKVAELNKQLK